jgi:predicted nucleotidyltransferase component of viral defense system
MFPGTLPDNAQDSLALLGKQDFFKSTYLAGGSSLALQLGHRRSVDFDFFTNKTFELVDVKNILNSIGKYTGQHEAPRTIVGKFNKAKFSLFYYPYKLVEKTTIYQGINLASFADIAAMKLVAITDRGTKKDYIDLYFLTKKCFPIEKMFDFYDKKYHNFEVNKVTLLKALQYFDDADGSEMPEMIEKVDWEEVKKFFEKETVRIAEKYLEP